MAASWKHIGAALLFVLVGQAAPAWVRAQSTQSAVVKLSDVRIVSTAPSKGYFQSALLNISDSPICVFSLDYDPYFENGEHAAVIFEDLETEELESRPTSSPLVFESDIAIVPPQTAAQFKTRYGIFRDIRSDDLWDNVMGWYPTESELLGMEENVRRGLYTFEVTVYWHDCESMPQVQDLPKDRVTFLDGSPFQRLPEAEAVFHLGPVRIP